MRTSPDRRRPSDGFVLGLFAALTILVAGIAGHPTPAPVTVLPQLESGWNRPPRLFKDSRQTLAIARAQGRSHIVLVVAAAIGHIREATADARRLGGDIRYRDDEIGYLRVRLPLDAAAEFSESAHVEAIAADWDPSYPNRLFSTHDTASPVRQASPKDAASPRTLDYPLRHPYSPLQAIDAARLRREHPTYDGRGVTIAVFDGTPDLLVPELQTAYTLDGKRVPKLVDVVNVTDPRDDADAVAQWVTMADEVQANGMRTAWRGHMYTTPHDGRFRIGLFDERRFNSISGATYRSLDVDFSGNGAEDDGLFGVLWDEGTGDVWVDTNRNSTFADEARLGDFRQRGHIGTFGVDDPSTTVRESIAFSVQTDPANRFVSINLGIHEHGTLILGAVVGNPEPAGRLTGIAPGARLVSMFYGSSMHAAVEGLIRAFRDPAIDLIVFESHTGMMTHTYLLADARHPFSILMQRLTDRHQKLMFVPGSNRPGVGLVGEDGLAPGVISVGAYESRESYLVNLGLDLTDEDHLHYAGLSHGPPGIGALKPDLLAPTGVISTTVGFVQGETRKGLYQLPPGYTVAGGTSTATPMAAGAAAIVLSAARQRGLRWTAETLKAVLTGTARFIPRLAAHEQGTGLVQVAAALARLSGTQHSVPLRISSRAPVRTALSSLLVPPNEGVGLYEREGWTLGQTGRRVVTLTRTTGPAKPMTFAVHWLGNDGTFSTERSVVLPLGESVALPVSVHVKAFGAHSAILVLDQPSMPSATARVLCTIVAALPLDAHNAFSTSTKISVPRASDRSVFINVPHGTAALQFSAASTSRPVRMTLVSPYRQDLLPCPGPNAANPDAAAVAHCAISMPSPGVWEINLWDGDLTYDTTITGPVPPKEVTVTASALKVEVSASGSMNLHAELRNRGAKVEAGTAAATALGSGYRTTRSISTGAQHLYRLTVPQGTTLIRAGVRSASAGADLDIYLLDCRKRTQAPQERDRGNVIRSRADAEPACVPAAKAADSAAGGEVEMVDPAPGEWAIVVDAFPRSADSVTYEYFDAFTHPAFGELAAADKIEERHVGAAWSAIASARVSRRPEPPRELYGRVTVTATGVSQAITDWTGQRLWALPVGSLDLFLDRPSPAAAPIRDSNSDAHSRAIRTAARRSHAG